MRLHGRRTENVAHERFLFMALNENKKNNCSADFVYEKSALQLFFYQNLLRKICNTVIDNCLHKE